jgi:DNA-binding NtrC family response regulator
MSAAREDKPAPRILVVDDDIELLRALEKTFQRAGYDVETASDGARAKEIAADRPPDVVVSDLMMPGLDGIELLRELKALSPAPAVLLITAHASIERAVEAMRLGAFDFVEKPIQRDRLLLLVERALERHDLTTENARLRARLADREGLDRLVGGASAMIELRRAIAQSAVTDVPVLVTGESGTGKEVVADLLHEHSRRKGGPLVKVSCAAIPESLLESELFGYERGAFTGAGQTKRGRFELADRGTLFLDEIGEMPGSMQAKLLRVLQDGRVQRLGGTRDVPVDVRVVAATNADLDRAMQEGRFRRDLYHRINVIEIFVPPLRDRPEDVPLLVAHFLRLHRGLRAESLTGVAPEAIDALQAQRWPGNVRELENTIQRALVTAPGPVLEASDLRFSQFASESGSESTHGTGAFVGEDVVVRIGTPLSEVEDRLIQAALRRTRGDKEKAARLLGISARTLYRRASRLNAGDAGPASADDEAELGPEAVPPSIEPQR